MPRFAAILLGFYLGADLIGGLAAVAFYFTNTPGHVPGGTGLAVVYLATALGGFLGAGLATLAVPAR